MSTRKDKGSALVREWEQICAKADREERRLTDAELRRGDEIEREMVNLKRDQIDQVCDLPVSEPIKLDPMDSIRANPEQYAPNLAQAAKGAAVLSQKPRSDDMIILQAHDPPLDIVSITSST